MLQISKIGKLKYIDEVLYSYRWHDTNAIRDLDKIKGISIKTLIWEISFLHKINETNSFDKYLPDVEYVYEKDAQYISVG